MGFKIIEIFAWVRKIWPILALPDWEKIEDVRLWILKVLTVADSAADLTPTEVDDQAVAAMRTVADSPQKFAVIYYLIADLVAGDKPLDQMENIDSVADEVGIDPVTLLFLINTIIAAIKWWRDRKAAEEASPETENND